MGHAITQKPVQYIWANGYHLKLYLRQLFIEILRKDKKNIWELAIWFGSTNLCSINVKRYPFQFSD